ncbi:hypothetical protein C8T65DRAFT_577756 [Cerioporus squamosus]|nr:hypothetical protein C8T65DRAFT_577756 [Cerioporus squamosus]
MSSIHLPALHMSNIIAADAPLTSPLSESLPVPWDRDPALAALYDPFSLPAPAVMPGSLPDTRKVLKGRMSPDVPSEQCLPTHQVFDFVPGSAPTPMQMSSPASTPESSPQTAPQSLPGALHTFSAADDSSYSVPAKRPSVSAPAGAAKKARSSGERVSTKDFVPPDVSGLTKREARLVKNRAAAFLSRQRKREEFENMEIRVAELEQENARLMASLQQQPTPPPVDNSLKSELEQLKRQLAETQQRERELAEKLSSAPEPAPAKTNAVKTEAVEPELPVSLRAHKGERSGASFGLMVLLCALPTLLSMPTHNAIPSGVSFNPSHSHSHSHSSSLDMFSTGDYDFGYGFGSGAMDLDLAPSSLASSDSSEPEFKKLELVDLDTEKFGMSGLDISFDASAAKDGRIRVRIHPPPASESDNEHGQIKELDEDQTMWHDAEDDLGPFLGVGNNDPVLFGSSDMHSLDFGFSSSSYSSASSPLASSPTSSFFQSAPSPSSTPNEYEFELGSDYGSVGSGMSRAGSPGAGSTFGAGRRKVRIALRGMPGKGKEGGEWRWRCARLDAWSSGVCVCRTCHA